MIELLHVSVAGIAMFAVGANVAFVLHLGDRLVGWFTFKIVAVTLLLVYVATSAVWGNPTWWRLLIGFVALVVDMVALFSMWENITNYAERGIVGLVPLLRPEKNLRRRG